MIELREHGRIEEATAGVVTGYAITYNSESLPIPTKRGSFIEVIERGAFDESIANAENISLLWNHDQQAMPLATTRAGTLELVSDSIGVRFTANIAETRQGEDYLTLLERGDLTGAMSFGFLVPPGGDEFNRDRSRRTITRGQLIEISAVDRGAYPASTSDKKEKKKRAAALIQLGKIRNAIR